MAAAELRYDTPARADSPCRGVRPMPAALRRRDRERLAKWDDARARDRRSITPRRDRCRKDSPPGCRGRIWRALRSARLQMDGYKPPSLAPQPLPKKSRNRIRRVGDQELLAESQ